MASRLEETLLVAQVVEALRTGEADRLVREAGWNHGQIAVNVHVTRPTVSRWFSLDRMPQGEAAVRFAKFMVKIGLPVRELSS